jgi:hypothetical protein
VALKPKKAKKTALKLGEQGRYRGPAWKPVIKTLGYDPRRFAGPKKSPTMTLNFSRRPGGYGAPKPPVTARPAPAGPPPTAAPTPLPAMGPAPYTPGGMARVAAARADWDRANEGLRSGAYQAALRYGDLGLINQLAGQGWGAAVTQAPELGELAGIERARAGGIRSSGEQRNVGNTFFSGAALKNISDINLAAEEEKQNARARYDEAFRELSDLVAQARSAYDTSVGEAEQEAWEQAQSYEPEEYGEMPAAPTAAARVHPTKTSSHVAAGLRRTGANTYVGPNGTVWHRTRNGTFARGRG